MEWKVGWTDMSCFRHILLSSLVADVGEEKRIDQTSPVSGKPYNELTLLGVVYLGSWQNEVVPRTTLPILLYSLGRGVRAFVSFEVGLLYYIRWLMFNLSVDSLYAPEDPSVACLSQLVISNAGKRTEYGDYLFT